MKKIFTYSFIGLLVTILFASCTKERILDDNSYWYSQERGDVVYSNAYCGLYVVETNYGYTVIQNLDGSVVYDSDVMYGDFGNYGSRRFYNHNSNVVTRGNVIAFDLSYYQAQDEIDYYCAAGSYNRSGIRKSVSAQKKAARTNNKTQE